MSAYTVQSASSQMALAALIANLNTNYSRIAAILNNGVDGGSTANNIKSATVQRVNMHNNASTGRFFGDIFSTNSHVRKGGTVSKSSGRVFNVAAGRWYVLDGSVTPMETRQVFNSAATTDSVLANRKTYLDMGFDGIIDKNDVAHGAGAPTLAAGHLRFAYLSASASIVPAGIVMLGNSTFAAGSAYAKDYSNHLSVVHNPADIVNDIIIESGFEARSDDNTTNINVTSNITVAADVSGANGVDTGSIANDTTYHIWVIADSNGANSPAGLISLSGTSPTMPTGYDKKVRVAMRRRGTANWHRATTVNKDTYLVNGVVITNNGTATAYTATNLATGLNINGYPNIVKGVYLQAYANNGAGSKVNFLVGRIAGITAASATSLVSFTYETQSDNTSSNLGLVPTSGSAGSVKYKVTAGNGIDLIGYGWQEL